MYTFIHAALCTFKVHIEWTSCSIYIIYCIKFDDKKLLDYLLYGTLYLLI